MKVTLTPVIGSASVPVKECGSRDAGNGYQTLANITSRNVPCPLARNIAFNLYAGVQWSHCHVPTPCTLHANQGWTLNVHWIRWAYDGTQIGWLYATDVRAAATGGRVAHFQAYGE
ncbi:MAG: hypothetical protein ACLP0J_25770 [Solirubrobacteraceae bacterium]